MAIVPTANSGPSVAFGGDFDSFKLDDAAYFVPCHGVGQTGHSKRVLNGIMGKDTGVFFEQCEYHHSASRESAWARDLPVSYGLDA